MNYYALFPTITSILFLCMGMIVFFKNKHQMVNKVYLYFCFSIFLWLFPFSLMYWSKDINTAYFFAKIGFIGVLLIPICMFYFVVAFLNEVQKYKLFLQILVGIAIPCGIINFFAPVFYSGIKICFWGYYPIAGKLYFIILAQFVIVFCYATWLLLKNIHNVNFDIIKQQQTKYLLIAFLITTFGVVDYISKYPLEVYPFGYILILAFIVIIARSIIKYNLMEIRVAVTNSSIFFALYVLVLGIPLYAGLVLEQWLLAFLLVFILSSAAPIIYRSLQKKAERILLSEQEKYQQFLLQASKGMVEQKEISKLTQLIVRMIIKSVKVKFAALFIYDEEKQLYFCIASRGEKLKDKKITFDNNSQIINFIKTNTTPFLLLNIKEEIKKSFFDISEKITLVVPAVIRKDLIAFMVLGDKINETLYSKRDLEVFKTLSNQAALAIENCNFLNNTNKQQKRLFEAEKLASIGGMADGLAHQIKNRLNNFSLIGSELEIEIKGFKDKYKEFVEKEEYIRNMVDYIEEMSDSIMKNVNKTNNILKGILSFAKTNEQDKFFALFSFKEIVEQSIELIKIKHHKSNISFSYDIPDRDDIYGVRVQIQEAVFNCIDNAYEATLEKLDCIKNPLLHEIKIPNVDISDYKPKIDISLKYVDKKAIISIKDNGMGIKEENKSKIFSAFFTTKVSSKSGSGIGSYVVKRMIVENHKGNIDFKSKYGYGTTFIITLPMGKNI